MRESYDAIIIGGGHNGLVSAAYLAKAGRRVLVLEQRHVLGGAAATEEVFPGFKVNTGAGDAGLFQDKIVQDLSLEAHGLEFRQSPVACFAPQPGGEALTLWRDEQQTVAGLRRFSPRDAERFPAFRRELNRMARILREMLLLTPPDVMARDLRDLVAWGGVGLKLKRLGKREMMEFLRVLPLAVAEYLDEWFESDALKGLLAAAGVWGNQLGPRGAGTAMMLLYQHASGFPAGRFVAGGIGQLSAALAAAAQGFGAEIRTGQAVSRVLLDNGRGTNGPAAAGVVLAGGREIRAGVVVSNADPRRTFFDLVGAQNLDPGFMRHVRNLIYRGCTAKVNLALSGLPQFNGQTDPAQLGGHILIGPSPEYVERAYDEAKYGRYSKNPVLDIVIPTVLDPALAPEGQHIMSITVQYAPYHLRQGDWETGREALAEAVIEALAAYAPGLRDLILHRQVLTPLDWEQRYGLTEGSIHHGQMSLDQVLVLRPVPGWSRYRAPVDNLFLCGAGAHPGGGVTGAPGYNAAREVLASS
ncbi:MAG: phytoene desaturase family protein [Anaerolineae bacterium]